MKLKKGSSKFKEGNEEVIENVIRYDPNE